MIVDRYVKTVLTIIAIALAAIAVNGWLASARLAPTPASAETAQPQYELTIPKAWGKIISYGGGNLLLEAADGTLREIDLRGKPPEYPRVKVQARFN